MSRWAPQSTVLAYGDKLPAPNAAQVNATMAHCLDFDDVHEDAIMHPGVVAIPTALAMAEYVAGTGGRPVSGKDFIAAIVVGTDFICRLGLATRPGESIHQYGWHLTTLFGYMTAAGIAARMLGLDEAGITNAIGIGYHQSSGNGQCVKDGVLTKRLGPGMAVRGGIASAMLAKRGVTGARDVRGLSRPLLFPGETGRGPGHAVREHQRLYQAVPLLPRCAPLPRRGAGAGQ